MDAERDAAVARLNAAFDAGQLALDELGDRIAAAHAAQTSTELAPILKDIPVPESRQHTSFGTIKRSGRWQLAAYTAISTTVGTVKVDLSQAEIVGPVASLAVQTGIGTIKVWLPSGWRIEVYGGSRIGGWRVEENQPSLEAAAPILRLRLDTFLGTVKVYRV